MKLTCTQENLRNALSLLERVVGRQSSLPILSNILFETEQGRLCLSATNLEIGIITSIGAKIESEGKITVPAKLIINFIQNLADDQIVSIEQMGTQVVVVSGDYTVKINGLDSKDFPIIPRRSGGKVFLLPTNPLREGLQKTLFCVSLNESRPELTGVLFGFRAGKFFLAATDSFRLAEWSMQESAGGDINQEEGQEGVAIIPAYTLQEVLRTLQQSSDQVGVSLEENQVFFEIGNTRIVSRLINGRFPEYQTIMPKQYSLEVAVGQEEFQRALKIATSFSVYSTNEVVFRLNNEEKRLEIESHSQGIGEQIAKIPYSGEVGQPFQIVFSPRYILEGVAAQRGGQTILSFNSPATPAKISSGVGQSGYTYIVMPIRK